MKTAGGKWKVTVLMAISVAFHFSLFCPQSLRAQETDDPAARFTALHRALARDPHDVETLYQLAHFFFDNANPMRNLPQALDYVNMAEQRQTDLLQRNQLRDLVQLQRKGITISTIRELKQAIHSAALESVRARKDLSLAEIDTYLEHFSTNAELVKLLRTRRYHQVFDGLLARGSVADRYAFIRTYPGTAEAEQLGDCIGRQAAKAFCEVSTQKWLDSLAATFPSIPAVRIAADRRRAQLAFLEAEADGSMAAYRAFLVRYPASDESEQARSRIEHLLELDLAKRNTAAELIQFADSNADLDIADQALARLRRLIYTQRDVAAAQYYVDHFKLDDYYSEVYSRYYSWYTVEGNGAPLQRFSDANPDFPFPHALEDDLERAAEIDHVPLLLDFVETAYDRYADNIRHMTGKAIAIVPMQRMLQSLIEEKRYADALFRLEQFEICFDNQYRWQYNGLRQLLSTPSENGERRAEPKERKAPRGRCRVENGDIYLMQFEGGRWRVSDMPPYPVNTDYVETDPYMLPDGSGMLLVSDRPGGYNLQSSGDYFHGDSALASDIWFIPYTGNRWGTPVNLGPNVNTPYCERYPVISRNLKTLYFVSDGHCGLGYGDIYVVERTDPSDWTSWGKPRNLGRGVNSGFRESDLWFSSDERRLFFKSRGATYSVATTHDTTGGGTEYNVNVGDLSRSLVRLYVADVDHQTVTQVVDCNGSDEVGVNLRRDSRYALLADAGTSFITATVVDPDLISVYRLPAYTYEELVAMDRPLSLPVVEFSADGAELLPVAQLQLEQLARFLSAHPQAVAELMVDVPGLDTERSYALSLERCKTLRDFFSQRGVAASRLLLSPYGNARKGMVGASIRFR